jgi:hypothetical protein
MRCGNPIHQSGSLRQLLFFTSTIVLGILIIVAHWGGKELGWFLLPDTVIGLWRFGSMIGIFLLVICLGWALALVHVWVVAPRSITVILFLAAAFVGVGILLYDPVHAYRREQPVVGLMLLFSIAAGAEVGIRRLNALHIVTALAILLVTIAFWFTVLILDAAAT